MLSNGPAAVSRRWVTERDDAKRNEVERKENKRKKLEIKTRRHEGNQGKNNARQKRVQEG
jgi:hypothetical protein